nr:hypothetical protein [Prevotella sp.]
MNIQKTRFCFYAILLIVLSLLASCIDDNEPVDKQETVTLYISANMGQTSGLTGTMHDCMLVKEKGDDIWNTWTLEGIKGFKSEIKNVLRFFIPDFAWTNLFLLNHILLYSLLFPFQSIQT